MICNSVLLLPNESEVEKAVQEFARVCQPNARVYLGEILIEAPEVRYRRDSVQTWLWSLLTRGGMKPFFAGVP
jgi:ubiquinone/menaquinone biosynthesis C-methylase UbiE